MDRMIYLSMAGAKAAMTRQDVLAHNLANASTTGFREELAAFRAVPVRGDGASTRVYALETTVGYKPDAGAAQPTGRNLDVAMKGSSWLSVQGLDGTEAYTRAGALEVNAEGLLVTRGGLQVMGDGGPISVPTRAEVQIAQCAPAGWRARRLQRQPRRDHGRHDLGRAPVRAPDEDDPDLREAGAGGGEVAVGQRLIGLRVTRRPA